MTSLTIYVSGPIAGRPDSNNAEFEEAYRLIRMAGANALLPRDIRPSHQGACPPDPIVGGDGHTWPCHLRADLTAMMTCDGVAMLAGWERSHGSRLEHTVAAAAGLPVFYFGEFGSIKTSTGRHLFEASGMVQA